MKRQKMSKKTWVWLPILLIIFLASSFIALGQPPREYPAYVSNSPSPTGVKALYTYLSEELESVQSWTHSPELLTTTGADQLLVMIEPSFVPSSTEMEQYEAFMSAGNTIMLFSENPAGMFNLRYDPISYLADDDPIFSGEEEFHALRWSPIRLITTEDDEIVLDDEQGVVAFKRQVGDGFLFVINEPQWLMNGSILEEDHIPLILFLLDEARASSIWFDDYVHGQENATNMLSVYPEWFRILMLQLLLFSLLWLLYKGKRFGPVLVAREETVRFSDEALYSLAAWFRRTKSYRQALQTQSEYVRVRMQERWGIPQTSEWKDIKDQLARKWDTHNETEVRELVDQLQVVLTKGQLSKQEYLYWAKKLNQIQEGVEKR